MAKGAIVRLEVTRCLHEVHGERGVRAGGQTNLQYITAGIERTRFRAPPDIVFVPESGPFHYRPHVVELEAVQYDLIPDVVLRAAHSDGKVVIQSNRELQTRFAFATSAIVTDEQLNWCRLPDLTTFDAIVDGHMLADEVLKWAGLSGGAK